jgi:hypothetical protein
MYSSSDFEKLWFLYRTEGEPNGVSINTFCSKNGVSYEQFNIWFQKTHKKVVPVQIDGCPKEDKMGCNDEHREVTPNGSGQPSGIMVTLQTRDGLYLRKSNLTYLELKRLVEKLEGLC